MILFLITISAILLQLGDDICGEVETKCTKEYCRNFINNEGCPRLNVDCLAMNSTHNGIYLTYPDVCNCCDYCLSNIKSGENCMRGYPGLLPLSISVCGHELSCTANDSNSSSTCQRIPTKCIQDHDDWNNRRQNGTLGLIEVRPICDNDGEYISPHCIPGSICYCIAPNGERIFGEMPYQSPWNEQSMTCGCGLNDWKMRNTLNISRWDSENSTGVYSARCTADGHYDPLQCIWGESGKCFCVDPVTGRPNKNILDATNLKEIRIGHPPCFDPSVHQSGKYDTQCELMQMSSSNFENSFDNVKCQPDGMFHRLQILKTRKICVNPSGEQITHSGIAFGANLNTTAVKNMNCNCARNIWLLSSAAISELPKCCNNGNFELWQCRKTFCYCVNINGDQIGLEVNEHDISNLSCYKNYQGQPCPII